MGKRDRFSRKKDQRRKIARERITILIDLAEKEAASGKPARSNRYGQLAMKIGKRYNVPLPKDLKYRFCKACGTYRIPSVNSRTRMTGQYITVHCLKCGDIHRRPYKRPHIKKERIPQNRVNKQGTKNKGRR
ncbi:MAG: ribonuclease P [Thermoplasmata archaeon]|nr:ribonuclease P [Thermoplasmata archaeon]